MLKSITKLYRHIKLPSLKFNTITKKSLSTKCILIIDASNIVTKYNISWFALFIQVMGKRNIYGGAIAGSTITLPRYLMSFFTDQKMSFYCEEINYKFSGEKFVDDFLHNEARKFISREYSISGKTMIFVTGDGNNNHGKDTFPRVIHDAIKHGFLVEIWSWPNRRSKNLTKLGEIYKDKVKINNLTNFIIKK